MATAYPSKMDKSVMLLIEREGVQKDQLRMSVDEARQLAEELLKASGIKFTLKF